MNANKWLFSSLMAIAVASVASAQQLPRTPKSSFGTLRDSTLPAEVPVAAPVVPMAPVVPASASSLSKPSSPSIINEDSTPSYNSEAAKLFTGRIQPMLANACVDCHARKNHTSRFKMRYTSGEYADNEASTANILAVARMINREKPSESPILIKAITAHGGATEPPLKTTTNVAFRTLETWVHWAAAPDGADIPESFPTVVLPSVAAPSQPLANPPTIAELTGGKKPAKPVEEMPVVRGSATHLVLGPKAPADGKEPAKLPPTLRATATPSDGFATGPRDSTSDPRKLNVNDEFDPAVFNRLMHPEKK